MHGRTHLSCWGDTRPLHRGNLWLAVPLTCEEWSSGGLERREKPNKLNALTPFSRSLICLGGKVFESALEAWWDRPFSFQRCKGRLLLLLFCLYLLRLLFFSLAYLFLYLYIIVFTYVSPCQFMCALSSLSVFLSGFTFLFLTFFIYFSLCVSLFLCLYLLLSLCIYHCILSVYLCTWLLFCVSIFFILFSYPYLPFVFCIRIV